jgi:hypothetical protein
MEGGACKTKIAKEAELMISVTVEECRIWIRSDEKSVCLTAPFELRKDGCFLDDRRVSSTANMSRWLEKNAEAIRASISGSLRLVEVDNVGVIFVGGTPLVRPYIGMDASGLFAETSDLLSAI